MMDLLIRSFEYWKSGGILLIPVALVSFGIWGYFIRSRNLLSRTLRDSRKIKKLLSGNNVPNTVNSIKYEIENLNTGTASIITLALRDASHGAPLKHTLEAHEKSAMKTLKKDIIVLAALTAAAPLLGLLGTVAGMIQTFDAVSAISGNTGARVAAGISQALITTQFGLVVAVPGIFGAARLQRMFNTTRSLMAECRIYLLAALENAEKGEL